VVIVIAAVILVVSLIAGFAPRTYAHRFTARQLVDLTGIASGLLLASALVVVVPEGFHTAAKAVETGDNAFVYPPVVLGATVLAGFLAMLLLEGFGVAHAVHEEHHDHVVGHGHGHVHHPTSSGVLAVGLSAHAMADGIAIGAAAAAGDSALSVLVAVGVLVHRIPAALSLGLFSLHERDTRRSELAGLVLFAVATPVTLLVSFVALEGADDRLVALILLFAAGAFVYVATVDTLPAIHNPDTGRRSVRNVALSAGLFTAVIFVLQNTELLEHTH
jgi:zinc transporter ZupT